MIIELNDDDTRLLYAVLLQQAQEHLTYADTSEVAQTGDQVQAHRERTSKNNDSMSANSTAPLRQSVLQFPLIEDPQR